MTDLWWDLSLKGKAQKGKEALIITAAHKAQNVEIAAAVAESYDITNPVPYIEQVGPFGHPE